MIARRRQRAMAALLTLATAVAANGQQPSPREIMERNFTASKVAALSVDLTMTLINDRGQKRERRNTSLIKLQPNGVDSKFLVRFSDPPDVAGTSLLQIEHGDSDDDLWIYLPALKKVRRLVASNKKDSFVGSDFSYGDIAIPKVDQYRHQLRGSEVVDGSDCWIIESTPASDAVRSNSGYSRKVTWVRKDNAIETKVEYYDLADRLLKTQRVAHHQPIPGQPGKWFAMEREMANVQTSHRTLIVASKIDGAVTITDDIFTTRTLERP